MKAKINNIEIEGTTTEMISLIQNLSRQKRQTMPQITTLKTNRTRKHFKMNRNVVNFGKSWSKQSEKELQQMFDEKQSLQKIANYFGRSKIACQSRYHKIIYGY